MATVLDNNLTSAFRNNDRNTGSRLRTNYTIGSMKEAGATDNDISRLQGALKGGAQLLGYDPQSGKATIQPYNPNPRGKTTGLFSRVSPMTVQLSSPESRKVQADLLARAQKVGIPQSEQWLNDLTPAGQAKAAALLADAERKQALVQKQNQLNAEARRMLRQSYKQGSQDIEAARDTLDAGYETIADTMEETEAHLQRTGQIADEMVEGTIADWKQMQEQFGPTAADAMLATTESLVANYDQEINRLQSLAKGGDPNAAAELQRVKALKSQALAGQLASIKVGLAEQRNALNTSMASVAAQVRTQAANIGSYASQLVTELRTRIMPQIRSNYLLNKAQLDASLAQLRMNGANAYADTLTGLNDLGMSVSDLAAGLASLAETESNKPIYGSPMFGGSFSSSGNTRSSGSPGRASTNTQGTRTKSTGTANGNRAADRGSKAAAENYLRGRIGSGNFTTEQLQSYRNLG